MADASVFVWCSPDTGENDYVVLEVSCEHGHKKDRSDGTEDHSNESTIIILEEN